MKELFDFKVSQLINSIADEIVEEKGVSKTIARKAVVNTLIYNCVIEEVKAQAYWLLGVDEED